MKKLRFAEPLPRLILIGKKDTTWRINDEKEISCGDELSLCYGEGPNKESEFARAKVIWIKETTFGELTEEDYVGHEKFGSEKEMYETYSRYYNIKVLPQTRLKVIKFKLLNNL